MTVDQTLARYRDPVIAAMRAALDFPGVEHIGLMRYHLGWQDEHGSAIDAPGGKMLRPALVLLACESVRGDAADAILAAAAVELLHNFTLIHDDIEDNSATRHGRPTLWTLVGVPLAINAGDGLFVLARRTLLDLERTLPPDRVLSAARLLDDACVELCEGQHADILFEERDLVSLDEYLRMIDGKTSALLGASMALGALAGGADDATVEAFRQCGRMLGRAFQIQDDVLGVWGEAAATGKPVADDIRSKKKSYPVVWAFENAPDEERAELIRHYTGNMDEMAVATSLRILEDTGARHAATSEATRWSGAALESLRGVDLDPARQAELESLARFFVERDA